MEAIESRRVQLLIERNVGYPRAVLEGVIRFAREAGNWICEGADLAPSSLDGLRHFKPHGIIAGLWDQDLSRRLLRRRTPVVDIFDWHRTLNVSRVHVDNHLIGAKAAQFFLEKNFKNFAFFGHHTLQFSVERQQAYGKTLSENGHTILISPQGCASGDVWSGRPKKQNHDRLANWLTSLPKPTAIFCANDGWGARITETCRLMHIDVPGQISVLGVDNDELLCHLSTPALSSIATNADRVGYEAAALLDRMMSGNRKPESIYLPPAEVIERQSTDIMQVSDPDIAMAVRFIISHAAQPITIDDIARHVVISRRTLQRRFKEMVGHSIHEEITRNRIERAKHLLAESDLSIPMIAKRCGLESRERLWRTFRQEAGLSPYEYRQQLRVGTADHSVG